MDDARLRVHVCSSFASDVRAALPPRLAEDVELVEFAAACWGSSPNCAQVDLGLRGAERAELSVGETTVEVIRAADGRWDCVLRCSGPAGHPLLNRAIAEQLVAEGAYLLTPGWARGWRAYLRAQGFEQAVARQFFHEFAAQLVLLDTGSDPQVAAALEEMGSYLDLPTHRLPCGLDHLRLFLTGLLLQWRLDPPGRSPDRAPADTAAQRADYAITLDMLGTLTGVTEETEVAERVLDLVTLLFAPGRANLLVDGDDGESLYSRPSLNEDDAAQVSRRLHDLAERYERLDDGFVVRIGEATDQAVLETGGFAVPEKRDDYLNLALTLSGACALAFANARSFARVDRARRELTASEQRYRALMEQAGDGIILIDEDLAVVEANTRAVQLLGVARAEVVGRSLEEVRGTALGAALCDAVTHLFAGDTTTISGIRTGGTVIDANFAVVDVGDRRIAQGILRDVTERERAARQLEELSLRDPLTGLHNRRGFEVLSEQQFRTAARLGQPLLLLFADVDGLKPVNDGAGHEAGDRLLCKAATTLLSSFRDSDIVARVGGDEFAVLTIDAGADDASRVMERLAGAITAANRADDPVAPLSLSVGAAAFDPAVPSSLDELLRVADGRMYAVKRGRSSGTRS